MTESNFRWRTFLTPKFRVTAVLAVLFIFLGIPASGGADLLADEVYIAGSTAGCFGAACTPGASATFLGLTYSNSTFAGTTANGFRGIGGNPTPGSNFNNLGSVSLSTAPNNYNGQTFTLRVTFTAPQGIAGSNQVTFTSAVTGTVVSDNVGGVRLDFDNTPILFTFNDTNCEPDPTGGIPGQQTTCGTGSFLFSINDVAIDPGQTVAVTGQITAAQQQVITAADAALKGRVKTSKGRGITNALVEISGGDLIEPVSYRTNQLGHFQFSGLTVGQTYVVTVTAKRFAFSEPTRIVTLLDQLSDFDFVSDDGR